MILIFAGAGASYAVDPKNYPTTVEFYKRLPAEINNSINEIPKLRDFLNANNSNNDPMDIEKALQFIGRSRRRFERFHFEDELTKLIIQGSLETRGWKFTNDTISSIAENLNNIESEIQKKFYDFYRTIPSENKVGHWKNLIEGINEMHHSVEIFTTNYDLVLDYVVDSIRASVNIYSGKFIGGAGISFIDIDKVIEAEPDENSERFGGSLATHGKFIKLHGSVNWTWMNNDIIIGPPHFTGDHSRHAILYPGQAETRQKESIFAKMIGCLEDACSRANTIIFIGFSFGEYDGHLNDIFKDIPVDTKKIVVYKRDEGDEEIKVPFDEKENAYFYDKGFSTRACMNFIDQSLREAKIQ